MRPMAAMLFGFSALVWNTGGIVRPAAGQERIQTPSDPVRQFDFWLGAWDVANRHLNPDGSWRRGGNAKANIHAALGGRVIVEQWTGQGALRQRGFSMRTYDAEQRRWEIILNWHSGSPSSFSFMAGNFSGGRGEFFPPGPQPRVRFTFSKATASSCQWDQAVSQTGADWKENWVMSFTRTGKAREIDAESLPIRTPAATVAGRFLATRELDGLIGVWRGAAKRLRADGSWEEGTAERRVSAVIDGFGLLQLTRFSWGEESIAALAFDPRQGKWFEVGMSAEEPDCHWLSGAVVDGQMRLNELPTSNNGVHHVWKSLRDDAFTWSRERFAPGAAATAREVVTVAFQRSQPDGRTRAPQAIQHTLVAEIAKAQSLIASKRFAAAETKLRALVKANSGQPRPQFLLGYTLHVQKKYDEAMKAYRRVAAAGPNALAEYNMACICSLQNKADEAFQHLDAAVKAGYQNFAQLAQDSDFDNIRNDERFRRLVPTPLSDKLLFIEPTRIIHKFVGESAGGQFGWTARRVGDWDGDGVVDFVTTAPTHAGAGKVYVYSSRTGQRLLEKSGTRGERFGNSAVGAGDVDRDGVLDLLVGAPNGPAAGNAYVFSGKDGSLIHHLKGSRPGDNFGYEVSEVGDLDNDGHADILVGATKAHGKQPNAGQVVVYSGKTGRPMFRLDGERTGDSFGNAAACTSLSDRNHLLAIGAQNAGPRKRGRVYVYRVRAAKAEPAFTIEGDANSVNFGQMFISFPGDLNGDGTPDIYASDFSDSSGARGGGKVVVCSGVNGEPLLELTGKRPGEGLGTSPSDAGDVNGDGVGDLVIGAWQNNVGARSAGKVYLHDGKTGRMLRAWTCRQAGDTFGFDACGIGDVDGDGHVDFLLTSAWSNVRGPKTGRVFIIAGESYSP